MLREISGRENERILMLFFFNEFIIHVMRTYYSIWHYSLYGLNPITLMLPVNLNEVVSLSVVIEYPDF